MTTSIKYVIAAVLFSTAAHAADVPKTYVLSSDQAAIVASWAAEKKATAQQVYGQADNILSEIQKQSVPQESTKK